MKKIVMINGNGGVGKDTLIKAQITKTAIFNVSSITPVLDIFEKSAESIHKYTDMTVHADKGAKEYRELLSNLKDAYTKYCDLSFHYIRNEAAKFLNAGQIEGGDGDAYLFVHIREPKEIRKFVTYFNDRDVHVRTVLIVRDTGMAWDNASDDNVADYDYEYVFDNNEPEAAACKEFYGLMKQM